MGQNVLIPFFIDSNKHMIFLQVDPAGTVEKLLNVNEVAVTGILLAIVAILIYFIVKLRQEAAEKDKAIREAYEMLIKEQKDYTHLFFIDADIEFHKLMR